MISLISDYNCRNKCKAIYTKKIPTTEAEFSSHFKKLFYQNKKTILSKCHLNIYKLQVLFVSIVMHSLLL